MPNYKQKIQIPISDAEFSRKMPFGKFVLIPDHQAFVAILQLTGLRVSEALALKKEQFTFTEDSLYLDVGERLKHSHTTPPLEIPIDAPYMEEIRLTVDRAPGGERVFPYCRKTGWNIVHRVFKYPHLHRLSRITNFALDGATIPELKTWTGLHTATLDHYIGFVKIRKMGKSLAKKKRN